jgi:PBP1b-binding outer membrane lipoprotein LpoB
MKTTITIITATVLAFLLAGCNEEKQTPTTAQETKDANEKLMRIAPRELPTPPPPRKGE